MLALVHPDVVWRPLTRPGRSEYVGHAGTRAMVDDLRRAMGDYRIDFESISELPNGRVLAVGEVVRTTPNGEIRGPRFDCLLTLRDRLVIALESTENTDSPHRETHEEPIRVLVVDDHEIFVQSLVRLLEDKPGIAIAGTAGRVGDAVAAARAQVPDVVLMDFELPDGDGPQATQQIKALVPSAQVIMLTARTDDDALVRAITAGCSGFVSKTKTADDLFDAIVSAHAGETLTPPASLASLLRQLPPNGRRLGVDLTDREVEVLRLVSSGLVNKQIAQRLGLSLNTIRNYVQAILYKLEAHSKLEAVATAVRQGLLAYPSEVAGH